MHAFRGLDCLKPRVYGLQAPQKELQRGQIFECQKSTSNLRSHAATSSKFGWSTPPPRRREGNEALKPIRVGEPSRIRKGTAAQKTVKNASLEHVGFAKISLHFNSEQKRPWRHSSHVICCWLLIPWYHASREQHGFHITHRLPYHASGRGKDP